MDGHEWKPFRIEDFKKERVNKWLVKHYIVALDEVHAITCAREKYDLGIIRAVECSWEEYKKRVKSAAQ